MASDAVLSKAVVLLLLLIHCLLLFQLFLGGFMLAPYFVTQYLVSFLASYSE